MNATKDRQQWGSNVSLVIFRISRHMLTSAPRSKLSLDVYCVLKAEVGVPNTFCMDAYITMRLKDIPSVR